MTKIDLALKYLGIVLQDPTFGTNTRDEFARELASLRPKPPAPRLPPISFDLTAGRFTIPNQYVEIWEAAYPAVDVKHEVAAAAAWLVANPKRAPRSSYSRFLNGWMSRTQQKGGTRGFTQTNQGDRRAEEWAKSL